MSNPTNPRAAKSDPAPVGTDSVTRAGLTIRELMDMLPCSKSTAHRLIQAGEIETFRIGRARRIIPASVDAYIERNRSKAA